MLLQVTQEDIDNGLRCRSMHCPVALALTRIMPVNHVVVGSDIAVVYLEPDNKRVDIPLSKNVRKFIFAFDSGDPIEPTDFEVSELDEIMEASLP